MKQKTKPALGPWVVVAQRKQKPHHNIGQTRIENEFTPREAYLERGNLQRGEGGNSERELCYIKGDFLG